MIDMTETTINSSAILEKIKTVAHFIHFPTLLLIAFTQVMMYFFILTPFLATFNIKPAMTVGNLVCLLLATIFIAAGAFVVNDYFDLKIDQINRPLTRVVGRVLSKDTAMTIYMVLTVIGIVFIGILGWQARTLNYTLLLLFFTGILWFYSSTYKRMLGLGNLIIAFFMGTVPILVAIYQNQFMLLNYSMSPDLDYIIHASLLYTGAFSFFMFGWTFVIEVIKDLATEKGDRELECHTFPIVLGVTKTKWILYGWITIMYALTGWVIYREPALQTSASLQFFICGMLIPACSLYYIIAKAQNVGDYKLIKNYILIIVAINIAYSYIVF